MEVTGLWSIREYVRRRQEKNAEYAAERQIYELCTGAESMEGSSKFLMWWYQEHGPTQGERDGGRKIK